MPLIRIQNSDQGLAISNGMVFKAWVLLVFLWLVVPSIVLGEFSEGLREEAAIRPDGIHVLDGSYVLNVGDLHINITNHGLIGSQYTLQMPYSGAPSGQWPGGSGMEYLWGAGLWIGGKINGQLSVTTGQPERELRPGSKIIDTIYEARRGLIIRPGSHNKVTGRRMPDRRADDDQDGLIDEDFLNGWDDDGDGLIDEDFGQIASQMFTCTMHDDLPLVRELYPDHFPLGVSVVQRAAAFEQEGYRDIVIFEYEISNAGFQTVKDMYLGMYVDCDIQSRGGGASAPDDLAGFYRGAVRDEKGSFHRLEVGWMADGAANDPLPGVFGTILLGHDTDPINYYAPSRVGINSFQIFTSNARGIQGGEPLSDDERYGLMARRQIDRDRRPDEKGDLKFMFASGPFGNLPPGRKLSYQVAMVIGAGMDEMLRNALKASEIYRGYYIDMDHDWTTGQRGRETKLCIGDYPPYDTGEERLFNYRFDIMDETCVGSDPVFGYSLINKDNMFNDAEGRKCIYVNADNCEECYRVMGQDCTVANGLFWSSMNSSSRTGVYGRETRVPWVFPGDYPPLAPQMRLVPLNNAVEVFWNDSSEYDPDPDTGELDFESYRVWRVANWIRPEGTTGASNPESALWVMLAEYDLNNVIPAGIGGMPNERSLGMNTGLEPAAYVPACTSAPQFTGLAEAMQAFVDTDVEGRFLVRPPLRDSYGAVIGGRENLLPWEYAPTVLDTFFSMASRAGRFSPDPVVPKRGVKYYHYLDTEVHNGFQAYYAVVASDHELYWDGTNYQLVGYGTQSDPGNNLQSTTPVVPSQTAGKRETEGNNIYVYPNPVTRAALAEFQQQPGSIENPTGIKILFNNLPAAHNTIDIFTTSGDLVQTLTHDGLTEGGAAAWNLMSRNGQEIVSGIYLYTVRSDNAQFETFRGHFTVVR